MKKDSIITSTFDELDEMLAEHEKFKQEYGEKYQNLSKEERIKENIKELNQVKNFINKTGMKSETIDIDK